MTIVGGRLSFAPDERVIAYTVIGLSVYVTSLASTLCTAPGSAGGKARIQSKKIGNKEERARRGTRNSKLKASGCYAFNN